MAFAHGSSTFLILAAVMLGFRFFAGQRRRTQGAGRRGMVGQASASSAVPGGIGHTGIPAGWLTDPSGRFDQRYWSGTEWTENVTKAGVPSIDPPPGSGNSGE
jgi:hypothetical protein